MSGRLTFDDRTLLAAAAGVSLVLIGLTAALGPAGSDAGPWLAALLPAAHRVGMLAMTIFDADGIVLEKVPSSQQLVELRKGRTAVVAGHDQKRIPGEFVLVERREQPADALIRLHYEIGIGIQIAFAMPFGGGSDRRVRRRQRKIQKERLAVTRIACPPADVLDRLAR